MALTRPPALRLAGDAERVRQSHARAISELQGQLEIRVIRDLSLANNVRTPVSHGLGRAPAWVNASAVRGSVTVGCIVEFRDGVDRTTRVDVAASGFGATVTVDLMVVG